MDKGIGCETEEESISKRKKVKEKDRTGKDMKHRGWEFCYLLLCGRWSGAAGKRIK